MKKLLVKKLILAIGVLGLINSCGPEKSSNNVSQSKTPIMDDTADTALMDSSPPKTRKYTGSFQLDDAGRFQQVYSSQNYGTFYELYAKCNLKNDYVTSIDLEIINFKGPMNIGFATSNKLKSKIKFPSANSDSIMGLHLVVKGLGSYHKKTIPLPKKVHKDSIKHFNIVRTLMPLNSDIKLKTENQVFDDEFYYRSGIGEPMKRNYKEGQYNPDDPDIDFSEFIEQINSDLDIHPLGNSGKCYKAQNNVYIKN